MSPLNNIVARDGAATTSTESNITPTMYNLLIALVVLFATIAVLVSGLLILRTHRNRSKKAQREADTLPSYNEGSRRSLIRSTLTINAPAYVAQEKQNLMDNSFSPPGSPIPEIRITFPEEVDEGGKRKSGRVVVVRVGEHTVGMEPVTSENLPPYQQSENDRFQSLDLERMGGLKEKVNKEMSSDKRWN
jgi:hypothetical protein